MARLLKTLTAALLLTGATAATAHAEMTVSLGIGANASPHSSVDYNFNNGTSGSVTPAWDGASFEMPPVYNARATYWLDRFDLGEWGVGVTFTHAKVKADDLGVDPALADFTTLEMTDGINFLTANLYYRFDMGSQFTP
ncbi:MAG: hypothetical protein AAFO70_04235 [Pseudomonadota bacterium]